MSAYAYQKASSLVPANAILGLAMNHSKSKGTIGQTDQKVTRDPLVKQRSHHATSDYSGLVVLDALGVVVGQRRSWHAIHYSHQSSHRASAAFGKCCKEAGV